MVTGVTTTRHDSGKGQQGDRMHNDFDGRHDDDKGQQGNRRHDDGNERAGWLDNQLMAAEEFRQRQQIESVQDPWLGATLCYPLSAQQDSSEKDSLL